MGLFAAFRQKVTVESLDYTNTKPLLIGCFRTILIAVQFVLLFILLSVIYPPTFGPPPSSKTVSFLVGVVPGIVFGGVALCLAHRVDVPAEKANSIVYGAIDVLLILGLYCLIFFYDPVASGIYGVTYLLSRTLVLLGIFGGSRIKAALV
ncbi:hypothetical protein E6P09_18685 (plasmid) [Haloferax mediterranei ATCC 33500]|uniref:DUF8100 domain-containing protein n=1 Tax=Haloferax mediterranei (strain ATCC 33500 / DSM 1411 / JCM 8866 / NBRC 14739 / NCIMB 2177 / R-4) TaxID=523841 RepID=M0J840_HALMT|nr:hypothetical protein [Haloferax mediterranei]AHZ24223.1 hypothetical protein BM92_18650 [Haloferax mediterranei ATCC 33500]EMA05302.1 hypothetical protein C439_00845 [Haloferax mediterranei ATCC 33500]MDX5989896.1 hypothetical protein [Haloferax mediterranei ATCC 33500]QCQ77337.1 hypothetical protein E6P09_18685 [Haloferax mediterranei ATCC 33500]